MKLNAPEAVYYNAGAANHLEAKRDEETQQSQACESERVEICVADSMTVYICLPLFSL